MLLNELNPKQTQEIIKIMGVQDLEEAQGLIDKEDYLLLTDEEAQKAAREEITRSLWAFSPNFLSEATGLPQKVFEAIQANGLCEDNNEAMWALVKSTCGLSHLVDEAIRWDGRGHFLAYYDHDEQVILGDSSNESVYLYRR